MFVKVTNQSNNPLPEYSNKPLNGNVLDSGMDVYANLNEIQSKFCFDTELIKDEYGVVTKIVIKPLGRVLIPTGIHAAVPAGYEIQVRDRSGNALKRGLIVVNGVGTIDSSYRGDIGVILGNFSNKDVTIEAKERIAQLVLCKVENCEWQKVEKLDETERGEGGYGHTGK